MPCSAARNRAISFVRHTAIYKQKQRTLRCFNAERSIARLPQRTFSMSGRPLHVGVLGAGGNMATAIIKGLLSQPDHPVIYASSPKLVSMSHLPDSAKSHMTTSNSSACEESDIVLLCVKPDVAPLVLEEIANTICDSSYNPVLCSVVAGMSTDTLQDLLSQTGRNISALPIVRAMPNLPASVKSSCTSISGNEAAQLGDLKLVEKVFRALGTVHIIDESKFAPATAIGGCGAAYVFMLAEAMADAAVRNGLSREVAMAMTADVIKGAGDMLQLGEHPALLRNKVESPGGVTIAATAELEKNSFRAAIGAAVDAAVKRTLELGETKLMSTDVKCKGR